MKGLGNSAVARRRVRDHERCKLNRRPDQAIEEERNAAQAGEKSGPDGTPNIDFDTILFDFLGKMPVPGRVTVALMVLAVILVAIFFVTGADSASIVMAGLSEDGAAEPTKKLTLFWGIATGAVAAVMLLAGGDDPAEALNGLKNITIVSAVPIVIVMLLLCVSLWKDLSNDTLVLRGQLARKVHVESVATGVEKHEGVFGLTTEQSPERDGNKLTRRLFGKKQQTQEPTATEAGTDEQAPNPDDQE